MDPFEASKANRLQQSLSSAWASFLSAQHCTKEVAALRRSLEEHTNRTDLSVAALQREAAQRHDLLATAVAESKSRIDHHAADLKETATLRASLAALQDGIGRDKENASRALTELTEKVESQQKILDELRSVTLDAVSSIREQWRSALESIESLQSELEALKAGKLASEQKLADLEGRIGTTAKNRPELSEEMAVIRGQIQSCQNDLMDLLGKQDFEIPAPASGRTRGRMGFPASQAPIVPTEVMLRQCPGIPIRHVNPYSEGHDHHPITTSKRKPSEPLESQPKRPPPRDPNEDIRTLYLIFRDRYKANPPKSDTAFIWEFLTSIQDPAMAKHIQESLAALLPDYITLSRDTRRKHPMRHVNISKGLTWRKFREALVRIPGPS
ncbi:hypothetical protein VTI74DRAFT_1214 [Chaetomium olivicolor]